MANSNFSADPASAHGIDADRKMRILVEAISDHALAMLDSHGRITSWGCRCERILGWFDHEIVGRRLSCLYRPEDVADGRPDAALRQAAELGRFDQMAIWLRRDGSPFWAHVAIIALHDDGHLIRYGVVSRDITAEIEAGRRLA